MAIPKIKATYSLDVSTVRALERLAERWNVTKSEVVRRAIRQADLSRHPMNDALAALDEVQQRLTQQEAELESWAQEVRKARRASEHARRGRDSV